MAIVDRFFKQGQRDFYKTSKTAEFINERTNPYNENSFRGKEWQRGFNKSYFDRRRLNVKRTNDKSGEVLLHRANK